MAIWERKKFCPRCNREVDILQSKCPYCGSGILSYAKDYDSSTTTISGETFVISSATAVTPSFTKIAKKYDNNIDEAISENSFIDVAIPLRDRVEPKNLEYYIDIEYLERLPDGRLILTELGKQAYYKNKEFRDEVEKNLNNVDI